MLSKRLSRVFSSTFRKHQVFSAQPSLWSNSHVRTILQEKTIPLTIGIFVSKVMSLLFITMSRFVIAFLPRSKCLLISWLWSLSAVIYFLRVSKQGCHSHQQLQPIMDDEPMSPEGTQKGKNTCRLVAIRLQSLPAGTPYDEPRGT